MKTITAPISLPDRGESAFGFRRLSATVGVLRVASATSLVLASVIALSAQILSLVAPADAVAPGAEIELLVFAVNPTTTARPFRPRLELTGIASSASGSASIELRRRENSVDAIPARGFTSYSYTLQVPAQTTGHMVIEISEGLPQVLRTAVKVQGAAADASGSPDTVQQMKPLRPAVASIERTFAGRLMPHEPIYFIYGARPLAAKGQFSFKYRLLTIGSENPEKLPSTWQFGYTQRSLWNINAASSPFYDTSYVPELFFESLAPMPERNDAGLTWLGYQTGFRHESNGRDGSVSRSLNTIYLRSAVAFGDFRGWHVIVSPELFGYVSKMSGNSDLKDYRGYGQLRLRIGNSDGPTLAFMGRFGRTFNHPTYQLDLTLPFKTDLLDFKTYFLIQYFEGYGESLLSYNKSSKAIRAGFSLVR